MVQVSSTFREINNVLRNTSLGLASNLELNLDGSQDLARLCSDGIGSVRHDVVMLQICKRLPQDILEAASRQWTNNGYDAPLDRPHAYAVALCYGYLLRI